MKKKILIAVILFALTAVTYAAPYGINIPLPTETVGAWHFNGPTHYVIQFNSYLGGHWSLVGDRRFRNGVYTDRFRGTVTDTSLNITFTNGGGNQWLSDSWYLENGVHGWLACSTFTVTISGGVVTGAATYQP